MISLSNPPMCVSGAILPRPINEQPGIIRSTASRIAKTAKHFLHQPSILGAVAVLSGLYLCRHSLCKKFLLLPPDVQGCIILVGTSISSAIPTLFVLRRGVAAITGGGRIDLFASHRDMLLKAKEGRLPKVAGREGIVAQLYQALLCVDKPNVVLVGLPGVGKTAIAEGLAIHLATAPKENLPPRLRNVRFIEIKVTEFMSGAGIVGSFEQRIEKFIADVERDTNLIIFIDEMHALTRVGHSAANATDILKPLLARGKCRIIGATTLEEYGQITKDGAFSRRFQRIDVPESTGQELEKMVITSAQRYADIHQCTYNITAIRQAIAVSMDRPGQQPDKALTLLDRAGAMATIRQPKDVPVREVTLEMVNEIAG